MQLITYRAIGFIVERLDDDHNQIQLAWLFTFYHFLCVFLHV